MIQAFCRHAAVIVLLVSSLGALPNGASAAAPQENNTCATQCVGTRDACAVGRVFKECLIEERLCLSDCDPQALDADTLNARLENARYLAEPWLYHDRPRGDDRSAIGSCQLACDLSARACIDDNNPDLPCREAQNACRARCSVAE